MIINLFGIESLKGMIFEVEAAATARLRRWASYNTVELKDEITDVNFYSNFLIVELCN